MRPGVIVTRDIPFPDPNVIAFLPPPGEWYSYKPILAPLPVVEAVEPAEEDPIPSAEAEIAVPAESASGRGGSAQ
jgi:hypothetical protein